MSEDARGATILVPVKAFGEAKQRLSNALDASERGALARQMAETVLQAAGSLPVAVVCDDDLVRQWALGLGATVLWSPGLGLNGAVTAAVATLAAEGVQRVLVAHADLPLATSFERFIDVDEDVVVLVPDRHDDGTNVMSVPAHSGFRFAYGPASFRRHCEEVTRLGLRLQLERDPELGLDVDVPADLLLARSLLEERCR